MAKKKLGTKGSAGNSNWITKGVARITGPAYEFSDELTTVDPAEIIAAMEKYKQDIDFNHFVETGEVIDSKPWSMDYDDSYFLSTEQKKSLKLKKQRPIS